jgi:hypothetical protein
MGGPTYELIGIDPVQGEDASRDHGVEAKHVFVAEEMPGLFGRALALCSHQDLDSVTRPGQESAAVKSEAAMPNLVRGSEAEDPDGVKAAAESANSFGQRHHYWVVCPDAPVDQSVAVQAHARQIGGRSRRGHGNVHRFCVIAVNAWMNVPAGFQIVDGEVTDVNPWRAMFNDLAVLQFAHMWVAAFMVVGFVVSGVYAVGLLRGRRDEHHRLGFVVPFVFASVGALVQPVIGHLLGGNLGERQPAKLAAFELATTTESPAPLRIGGLLINGKVYGAIDIPVLGSLIARNSFTEPVPGLDTIPVADQPPVNITHWAFQAMIGVGTLLAIAVVVFWVARWRGRDLLYKSGSSSSPRPQGRWPSSRLRPGGSPPRSDDSRGWCTASCAPPTRLGTIRACGGWSPRPQWSTPG